MKKIMFSLLIISLFLILSNVVVADTTPLLVEVQGVVKNSSGNLLDTGTIVIKDQGIEISSTNITGGFFNMLLGSTVSLEKTCGDLVYLQLEVNEDYIGDISFIACSSGAEDITLNTLTVIQQFRPKVTYKTIVLTNNDDYDGETTAIDGEWTYCSVSQVRISDAGQEQTGYNCNVWNDDLFPTTGGIHVDTATEPISGWTFYWHSWDESGGRCRITCMKFE